MHNCNKRIITKVTTFSDEFKRVTDIFRLINKNKVLSLDWSEKDNRIQLNGKCSCCDEDMILAEIYCKTTEEAKELAYFIDQNVKAAIILSNKATPAILNTAI